MKKLSISNNTIIEGINHIKFDIYQYIEEASLIVNATPIGMNNEKIQSNAFHLVTKYGIDSLMKLFYMT